MNDRVDKWATREDVREMSRDLLAQIDRRFDDQQQMVAERHQENVTEMRIISDQWRITNGRVTTLEEICRTLKEEFQGIRRRWHDFRDSIQKYNAPTSGENRHITMRDVYMFAGGIGSLAAVLKAFKVF